MSDIDVSHPLLPVLSADICARKEISSTVFQMIEKVFLLCNRKTINRCFPLLFFAFFRDSFRESSGIITYIPFFFLIYMVGFNSGYCWYSSYDFLWIWNTTPNFGWYLIIRILYYFHILLKYKKYIHYPQPFQY